MRYVPHVFKIVLCLCTIHGMWYGCMRCIVECTMHVVHGKYVWYAGYIQVRSRRHTTNHRILSRLAIFSLFI